MKLMRLDASLSARWRDAVTLTVWLVVLEIDNATIGLRSGWEALGGVLVTAMTLAAAWRKHSPTAFAVLVLALASILVAVWHVNGVAANRRFTPLYVVIFVPYVAARESSLKAATAVLAAVEIWAVGLNAWAGPTPVASYLSTGAVVAAAWGLGRWLCARPLLHAELVRNTAQSVADRENRIRLAVADERTRVAQELHALIGSNVSAMVIQAEAAELQLEAEPVAAETAMEAVERTGRDALADMRRLLGVLRHAEGSPLLAPQPGVGEVYALVEAARASNRSIELSVEGEPGPVPASVDLAIYRVLEEALHSCGSGRTKIHLWFTDDGVKLEVSTEGVDGTSWPTPAMRERAALCDGRVAGQVLPDSRWFSIALPRTFAEVSW